MTSLKCWNSGVESNGAAFILSPVECGCVSRDSGACGKEVSSSRLLGLTSEFGVCHAASDNLFHDGGESFRIGGLSIVVAKGLLIEIAEQVKRLHADVGAVQTALKQTPEVLHRVRVDIAVNVLDGVIDDRMAVVSFQPVVGQQFVTEDSRARFDVFADDRLKFSLRALLNMVNYDFSAAFDHAEYDLLTFGSASLNLLCSLGLVHIAGLTADERLIDFDFASERVKTPVLHGKADAVQHEPRGFLGDAKPAMQFVGTDTVFCPNDHPSGGKPLLKADRGLFEDCASLEAERRAGMLRVALPYASLFQVGDVIGAATRAFDNAIRPAQFDHELSAMLEVREPDYRVPESVWRFHVASMQYVARYVNYIIAITNNTQQRVDKD